MDKLLVLIDKKIGEKDESSQKLFNSEFYNRGYYLPVHLLCVGVKNRLLIKFCSFNFASLQPKIM